MKKIGLALSGGGFRATLYHLGPSCTEMMFGSAPQGFTQKSLLTSSDDKLSTTQQLMIVFVAGGSF
jgi:hypothetical protein